MATTPNYSVNYDDKRFTEVSADKKAAMSEVEKTYGGMISNSDKYYQKQINAVQDYADKQAEIQNQKTDFAIEQIEQQKEQAKQDYTKEQSGAYVDWQKQSNQYGANAEQMAAQGMQGTGFSESSQVSMYNTYQIRVATAREVYNRAVLNYDNAIKDARLQNNAALAEIAFNSLQKQLELSLAGFQYKNSLITERFDKKMAVDETYHNRWQDVLNQINTENALAENVRQFEKDYEEGIRQFNKEMDFKNAQLEEQKRQHNETLAEQKRQFNAQQAEKAQQQAIIKKTNSAKAIADKAGKAVKNAIGKAVVQAASGGSSKTTKSKSTYNKAADTMKKAGAIKTGDGGLMTKTEWTRRKNSGSNRAETSYATYDDYVNSFTAWRIANPEK